MVSGRPLEKGRVGEARASICKRFDTGAGWLTSFAVRSLSAASCGRLSRIARTDASAGRSGFRGGNSAGSRCRTWSERDCGSRTGKRLRSQGVASGHEVLQEFPVKGPVTGKIIFPGLRTRRLLHGTTCDGMPARGRMDLPRDESEAKERCAAGDSVAQGIAVRRGDQADRRWEIGMVARSYWRGWASVVISCIPVFWSRLITIGARRFSVRESLSRPTMAST